MSEKNLYPEHDWKPWLFHRTPKKYMESKENQRKCLDWVWKQLDIKNIKQWKDVTIATVVQMGGGGVLLKHQSSLNKALHSLYPGNASINA